MFRTGAAPQARAGSLLNSRRTAVVRPVLVVGTLGTLSGVPSSKSAQSQTVSLFNWGATATGTADANETEDFRAPRQHVRGKGLRPEER